MTQFPSYISDVSDITRELPVYMYRIITLYNKVTGVIQISLMFYLSWLLFSVPEPGQVDHRADGPR